MSGKISVVVGGQYGSEAKGHVAGFLAKPENNPGREVVAVRVAGPNAGHTAYDADGKAWALRQVPVMSVTNPDASLVIAAGSEIDLEVLADEITRLDDAGFKVSQRLIVDPNATIIMQVHKDAETGGKEHGEAGITRGIGSTGKGVGAARADRAMRKAIRYGDLDGHLGDVLAEVGIQQTTGEYWSSAMDRNAHVIVEGTQGYGLGVHHQNYPFTTSSDCRAIDFLAMAGINPWTRGADGNAPEVDVWVVLRVLPIRVAGNSGPLENETSWEALGLPVERTTVTKKVRRVGRWDSKLAYEAVRDNGGPDVKIALTMLDQAVPGIAGLTNQNWRQVANIPAPDDVRAMVNWVQAVERDTGAEVRMIGTGPNSIFIP